MPQELILNKNIFNTEKNDYSIPSIFLGQEMGLYDSINKHYPKIFNLYKQMKSQDWDEAEFSFHSCNAEFKSCDPITSDLMIKTLAWQWSADSVAARSIHTLAAPFISSNELNALYMRIADNECLTGDHEVLTHRGWKRIDSIILSDKIAQWDYETHSISFTNPERLIDKDYSGQLYHFYDKNNNVSQLTTPNHRMPIVYPYWTNINQPQFKTSEDVLYHGGNALPTSGFISSGGRRLTPQERMYIAVQADGSLCSEKYTGKKTGHLHYRFGFSKKRKIKRLLYLCDLAGWSVTEIDSENDAGIRYFIVYVPISEYNNKAKTFDWFDLDQIGYEWAEDFINELQYWDGNITKGGKIRYISTNKSCVDKVSALAHLIGCRGHITTNPPRYGVMMPSGNPSDTKESYQVHITNRHYVTGNSIIKSVIDYSGKVYCLTVPTGYFLIRHNNSVTVTGNCLHALTYSEIVRYSFDESAEFILNKIISNQEAFRRLKIVSKVFNQVYEVGHRLALGLIFRDSREAYDAIFMFIVAMYCLERIQFQGSFAVTFTIANTGIFVPIGTAIQKICQDELLHAKAARTVLDYELSTERGLMAFNRLKETINKLIDEVVLSEIEWTTKSLFVGTDEIVGLNSDQLCKYLYHEAKEVYDFFGMKPGIDITFPDSNPLWFLADWINIDKVQKSPQEEKTGNYVVGSVLRDDEGIKFDLIGIE